MKKELIYIWLDKEGQIRSKTKYADSVENWSFDGSSTNQAVTQDSDIKLIPVSYRSNEEGTTLVLCSMEHEGKPIESDYRVHADKALNDSKFEEWMFGFEQEFVIMDNNTGRPIGWPLSVDPAPQGEYYCGNNFGRQIVNEHAKVCIGYGLSYFGNNAEVMPGQWEYQIGPADDEDYLLGISYCDDLIFSRFLLQIVAENSNCKINYSPKPMPGDWNGSGLHTNFSTRQMRDPTSFEKKLIVTSGQEILNHMDKNHEEYIHNICGKGWETRLTGRLETSDPRKFTVGSSNRECSVRIPPSATYLEDRRPCANANPYRIVASIVI